MKRVTLKRFTETNTFIFSKGSKLLLPFFMIFFVTIDISAQDIDIYYTNGVNGTLEYCGCPKSKSGGLSSIATISKKRDRENSIFIDAGNIFSLNCSNENNKVIPDLINIIEYDAINISKNELCNLSELEKSKVNTISLNINSPFVQNEIIIEKKNIKIGIIGTIDYKFHKHGNYPFLTENDFSYLTQKINSLSRKTDIVIFLSGLEPDIEERIFLENKNIDIFISSLSSKGYFNLSNRAFTGCGDNAEFMGKISVSKTDDKLTFKNDFIDLSYDNIPEDEEAKEVVGKFNILGAASKRADNILKFDYYEPDFCKKCHIIEENIHSQSYSFIESAEKFGLKGESDTECYYCHTTGYKSETGFNGFDKTSPLSNITCTECHKIEKNTEFHPLGHDVLPITEKTCTECHTRPFTQKFDKKKYFIKLLKNHRKY